MGKVGSDRARRLVGMRQSEGRRCGGLRTLARVVGGRIVIMADHPRHGTRLGTIRLSGREPQQVVQKCARVRRAAKMKGKHALYFVFARRK